MSLSDVRRPDDANIVAADSRISSRRAPSLDITKTVLNLRRIEASLRIFPVTQDVAPPGAAYTPPVPSPGNIRHHGGIMTELNALFERAVNHYGELVQSVGAGRWHDPTPCTDWDVRELVNHVTVEQLWLPPLVEGKTVADIGNRLDGDQLGDDPVAAWDAAAKASVAALCSGRALDGTVHLSRGETPTSQYAFEMTLDALIHGWDLARAIGANEALDPETTQLAYEAILPMVDELQKSGMFAPPIPTPDDAPVQTKLLAILGRTA
jgi:uncharacterized protein (TIGR03086 family)